MKRKAYRHGDVIVLCNAIIPVNAKRRPDKVVAEGEVTGHAHRLRGRSAYLLETDDRLFARVDESATLTHEEHAEIELPAGEYEIRIQREYEPEGWRYVQD